MRFPTTAAFIAAWALVAPASAELITYTHVGLGSGTLDGQAFTQARFVVTAVADTGDVVQMLPFVSYTSHLSSSITIDGVGTFDFVTETMTFAEHLGQWGAPSVGLGIFVENVGPVGLFWGPLNSAFGSWDTTTPLDTVIGDSFHIGWQFQAIETTGGALVFDDSFTSLTPASFSAAFVPAPGALALLSIGAFAARRRRRA